MNKRYRNDNQHSRRNANRVRALRPERLYTALEERTLFDAAVMIDMPKVVDGYDAFRTEFCRDCEPSDFLMQREGNANSTVDLSMQVAIASTADRHEIVFVDEGVSEHQAVMEDLRRQGIESILIKADQDGVSQIASALNGRPQVEAIHIISHGDSAELYLGDATLSVSSMFGQHADALAQIRGSLAPGADLLIYGCNFGEGAAGRSAAALLAEMTSADVAASDDLTGHQSLGGDWQFEVQVGQVESEIIVSHELRSDWVHTLVAPTIDLDADDSSGAVGNDYEGSYVEGGAPQNVVDADVLIGDVDSPTVSQAIVTLTNAQPGDVLFADDALLPGGISVDSASTPTHIILTGADSFANYQTALNQVTFENTLDDPIAVDRVIEVSVNDGTADSTTATSTIHIHAAPVEGVPDYVVTKDDGLFSAAPGDTVTYTITIENHGDQHGTGVVLTDNFPASQLGNVVASDNGFVDLAAGTITWNIGDFAIGESRNYTVTADILGPLGAGVDALTNTATVTDDRTNGDDPTPDNNTDADVTIIDAAPDYEVTKDDGVTAVSVGDTVTYTIEVTNIGNQDGTNVIVTDTFPVGLFATVVADGGGVVNPTTGMITWNLAELHAGDTVVFTMTGQIVSAIPAGFDNLVNSVSVSDDGNNGDDPNLENNVDEDSNQLFAAPDLSITKTDNGATAAPGQTVVYTLTYTNTGSQDATGVFIDEALPVGTVFNADNSTPGWQDLGNGRFRFFPGNVAVGEVRVIEFAVTVTDLAAAGLELSNTASVGDDGSNGADPTPGNNTSTDTTPVAGGLIEGFVFSDVNGNGIFDSGEAPLEGVLIELTGEDSLGNPVQSTTTTDANGRYAFADLPTGLFNIRQVQPANFTDGVESSPTGTIAGNDLIQIPLSAGETATANNFAEAGLAPGLISKRYFLNSTNSGVYSDVVLGVATATQSQADPPPAQPLSFTTTASGLMFRILSEGAGARPNADDTVTVNYRGWFPDPENGDNGPEFDSSFARGRPSTFGLGNVIQGWTEGLQLVREGGTIELEIPPELAYGSTGTASGSIPPNATLRFVVELISIA